MDIKKCDLCKKEIKDRKYAHIRFDVCESAEFCENCASPIYKFLEQNNFLDKKEIKKS